MWNIGKFESAICWNILMSSGVLNQYSVRAQLDQNSSDLCPPVEVNLLHSFVHLEILTSVN